LREVMGRWVAPAEREPVLIGPTVFRIHGREAALEEIGWDGPGEDRLWRYHQHYFDDLTACGTDERRKWHEALIARWMAENPPGRGTGWEPYPVSRRIVNWIKAALGGFPLGREAASSLALQARWLSKRIEWHLLGNHLLANAKALVFAGCFFEGQEADAILRKGLGILDSQLPEQVLPDGGHFELSPMYHALVLEDMLDLMNLQAAYPQINDLKARASEWEEAVSRMSHWLFCMTHPDGEIAFFNDAAFGMAPPPAQLLAYSSRLGLKVPKMQGEQVVHLENSGYLRLNGDVATAFLDCARVGPDYLPGHAHADTLSFELSVMGERLLVNSGTSCYGQGKERLRQRGTAAHNTVVVDGRDSSEVWSGFRVARRAYPEGPVITGDKGRLTVSCSHNGYQYLRGRSRHHRKWLWYERGLVVEDRVEGGYSQAQARFHVHPRWDVICGREKDGTFRHKDGKTVRWTVEIGCPRLEAATFHPRFGETLASQCLSVELEGGRARVGFEW
jgi:uncharacterized heparinase superfamily protein